MVHDAFGGVAYDEKTKQFNVQAYREGKQVLAKLKVDGQKIIWGFTQNAGRKIEIRFTLEVKENKWKEIGEVSLDGKTWRKFMEMNLTKQK